MIVSELLPCLAKSKEHQFVALLADEPENRALAAPNLRAILVEKPKSLARRAYLLNVVVPRLCARERVNGLLCMGNFAPRRPGVPTVVSVRNAYYARHEPVAFHRATWRERMIIRYGWHWFKHLPKSIQLVVETEVMRRRLVNAFRLDPQQVKVIPNTLNPPTQWERPLPDRPSTQDRPFTFLCLARYYPHKNHEVLVEAMKRLQGLTDRPARCIITIRAQDHPGARRLLKAIRSANLESSFVNAGPVPNRQVGELYRQADAFILPTLLESFGRAYLEAMHFGLPILTSDRDFARHLCGQAALYFEPLRAESVAQACARIMNDPPLAARLTEHARGVLSCFPDWDEIAEQFIRVLTDAALSPMIPAKPAAPTETRGERQETSKAFADESGQTAGAAASVVSTK